jgi:hypothetical protein
MMITGGNINDTTMMTAVLEDIRVPRAGKGRPRTRPDRVLAGKGYPSRKNRAWLRTPDKPLNRQRQGSGCSIFDDIPSDSGLLDAAEIIAYPRAPVDARTVVAAAHGMAWSVYMFGQGRTAYVYSCGRGRPSCPHGPTND